MIRTCRFKIQGQEASWVSEVNQEMLRTIRSARAMVMGSRQMEDEVVSVEV